MNPKKSQKQSNQPLSFAKVSLIISGLMTVIIISIFVYATTQDDQSQLEADGQVDDADQSQITGTPVDEGSSQLEGDDPESHQLGGGQVLYETDDHEEFHEPHHGNQNFVSLNLEEDSFEDVNYDAIIPDTEEKSLAILEDSFKADDITNLRHALSRYYVSNGNLPNTASVVTGLIAQNNLEASDYTDQILLFQQALPLTNNLVNDLQLYYSPTDINYRLDIPANSLIIIGQAKCNTANDTRGIRVKKQVVSQVSQVNNWGQPVNYITSNTTIAGHKSNLAMIFRLSLQGADYTYCHHDYMHNYNLNI